MPNPDEPSLRNAVQCPLLAGDIEPWLRCCTARFLPLARRVAGDDDLAHDALQTAWILVMQRLNTYRGGPPACSWVHSIVRHEASRAARPRRWEEPLDTLPESPANWTFPEADTYAAELRRVLLEAIDDLPPTYREVVRLRDVEEHSNAEVAERLHISKRNVAVPPTPGPPASAHSASGSPLTVTTRSTGRHRRASSTPAARSPRAATRGRTGPAFSLCGGCRASHRPMPRQRRSSR